MFNVHENCIEQHILTLDFIIVTLITLEFIVYISILVLYIMYYAKLEQVVLWLGTYTL